MSYLLIYLMLTLLQLIAGFGLLTLLHISLKPALFIPLCILCGVAIFSFLPFLLQLFYISINAITVYVSIILACLLLNLRCMTGINRLRNDWFNTRFTFRLYEIPALLVITAFVLISAWRCFYLPPTPRDLNSGAEAIASFAVREGTMINSVFSVDVSNNVFKPAFITSLQIIYKLSGFSFGQVWLTTIFISFIIFLYHALRLQVHRILAGLLLVFLLSIPELYGYTFIALFDFSNAVFFCCALFMLFLFFENQRNSYLIFSALLMGAATYIRSETLVLACLLLPAIISNLVKNKTRIGNIAILCISFVTPSLLLYIISVPVYINFYLPGGYPVSEQVNAHLTNLQPFFKRFADINTELIFGQSGMNYYGYFFFLFLLVLLPDTIFMRRFNQQARNWLFAILVLYIAFPLLGYFLPLLDLHNSTKRGLMKIFPLMLFYMSCSQSMLWVSKKIDKWERRG